MWDGDCDGVIRGGGVVSFLSFNLVVCFLSNVFLFLGEGVVISLLVGFLVRVLLRMLVSAFV